MNEFVMSTGSSQQTAAPPQSVVVRARNIGGIDETEVTLHRGITALTGRNATNRTSLLQAIMAALGSDDASLKADADEGRAVLDIGDETYEQTLHRRNGTVVTEGEPYLEDSEIADLFAFLLENNEARRAVARGDDLRDIIMRPVDTDAIREEISRTEQEKRDIDQRLSKLEDLSAKLPDLEQKRTRLTNEIEELREELSEAREQVEDAEAGVEETREEKDELDAKLDELQETRSELERVRRRIDTERESIDALEDEHDELADELEDAPERPGAEIDRLESEIDRLQNEKEELTAEISQLQSTIQFNEERLESAGGPVDVNGGSGGESGGDVTDQLLPDSDGETVECWTCGSSVARDQIETTIEQLRSTRQERLDERSELSTALRETRSELSDLRDRRDEHERTRKKLDSVEGEIEEREDRVEQYEERRSRLTEEIGALEDEVERLEEDVQDELLDQHKEVNELEFELGRLEEQREDVEEEISSIEDRLDEREELEERRETVAEELTELRTRIDRIEADAVEAFNEHMEQVLDVLGYENLDRIWIERTEREVRQGRRKVEKTSFDLKIVRSTDSGAAYEDDIDHLSESEREVTGLVFALAGYLVHDVHETVPFMLLDSLEAIDSARIADLIEYFRDHVPYLTVALLEEDAAALEAPHERVTEI
jgi:DNA repair exonuclease SbcCD ATPase subunit